MELKITRQERFSRGQLLLRTIFGIFYITFIHFSVLLFVELASLALGHLAFWVVLFKGKYPQHWFDFQVKVIRWHVRYTASLSNLMDGYPAIGTEGSHPAVTVEVKNPERLSRGLVLLRLFFGFFYILIPHGFCLFFRLIWGGILSFLAWWVILFTGKYPESWHNFQVGTLRWTTRLSLYLSLMTDEYPPFSGK